MVIAGTYTSWQTRAIGSGSVSAQNTLTEEYNPKMSLAEAKKLALKTLKSTMEEKVSKTNVEVAQVTQEKGPNGTLIRATSTLGEAELEKIIASLK